MTAAQVVPAGWHHAHVADVARVAHGFAFDGESFRDNGVNALVTPGNFFESGGFRVVGSKQRYYTGQFPSRYKLRGGDLIVAMTEQAHGLLGSAALVPETGSWLHNQRVGRVKVDPTKIRADYLQLVFNTSQFRRAVNESATGTKVRHTSPTKLEAIEILVPPRAEQDVICDVVRDASDLVASIEGMITKKQAIKEGMAQQLLTDRVRLADSAGAWRVVLLGDLLSYEQPGRYLVSTANYSKAGTPVLTAGKTFLLGHTTERSGIFRRLPVIIFDDFTTASKFVDFPFKAKSSAMKMLSARPGANLRYVYELMQLMDFVAVDHKRRWIAEYSKVEVQIPEIEDQDRIAAMLTEVDSEIDLLEQQLQKARAVKLGMMQELLTGRSRLSVAGAAS